MTYTLSQPVSSDFLSVSAPKLATNTNAADASFGQDHYEFSNTAGNTGLHKKVTTVPQVSIPTTTTNPILVAYSPYAAVGAIQYSCGPGGGVPSPITALQSASASFTILSGGSVTILDFTGINYFLGSFYATGLNGATPVSHLSFVGRANGNFSVEKLTSSPLLNLTTSSANLILEAPSNTITNIIWSLNIERIQ